MSESPSVRAMTAEDYVALYGERPRHSMKGYAALLNGRVVAVGGIAFLPTVTVLFAKMDDALRPHRRFIVGAAAFLAEMAREYNALAIADPHLPLSGKLLRSVGSHHVGSSPHGEVYRWMH
jgi:hypothetical protein